MLERAQQRSDGLACHFAGDLAATSPLVTRTHFDQSLRRRSHIVIGDAGNGAVVCGLGLADLVFERLEKKFGSIGVHMNLLSSCAVPWSVGSTAGAFIYSDYTKSTLNIQEQQPIQRPSAHATEGE